MMYIKKLILAAATAVLAASCGSSPENTIEFKTVTTEKTVNLSNEALSPTCSVSLNMAYATEANGERAKLINATITDRLLDQQDESVQAAAEQFAEKYTKSYITHMLPLYNQDRADTTKRAWYEYHYVITTETHPGSKGTMVYLATVDYFEGGAHGINQLLTMNFDIKTGQQLTLSDIFVPGYEQQLNQQLVKALKAKTGAGSIGELKEQGYLFSMDMFPSENFILGEETITFVYNPYEIAPYALGKTELTIPYSDIKDLLKTTFDY